MITLTKSHTTPKYYTINTGLHWFVRRYAAASRVYDAIIWYDSRDRSIVSRMEDAIFAHSNIYLL